MLGIVELVEFVDSGGNQSNENLGTDSTQPELSLQSQLRECVWHRGLLQAVILDLTYCNSCVPEAPGKKEKKKVS